MSFWPHVKPLYKLRSTVLFLVFSSFINHENLAKKNNKKEKFLLWITNAQFTIAGVRPFSTAFSAALWRKVFLINSCKHKCDQKVMRMGRSQRTNYSWDLYRDNLCHQFAQFELFTQITLLNSINKNYNISYEVLYFITKNPSSRNYQDNFFQIDTSQYC